MDNMAYLQQISASTNTSSTNASPLKSLMSGKLIKILIGLVILSILIIIFGSILSNSGKSGNSERSLTEQAELRCSNLIKTINTYNPKVKSSSLRSSGNSLASVLSETDNNLKAILKNDFGSSTSDDGSSSSIKDEETAHITQVNSTLENASLNAVLDRNYARQMALEISLLLSIESGILARTEKASLKATLTKSTANLTTLHDAFDNFSETKY